jgi:hypothetical protein
MAENHKQLESTSLRPSDFMRARRPKLFSDTQVIGESSLGRSFLDYYLEKLTSRSQEKDFEHFCRKLAEKELCPNLLPQTGPTGGGDSKVDSETYPVADAVSLLWYEGVGREAASERWAFAISTKQKWRDKVRSDVKSIVGTQRGYALIYFISSQYIKDKDRASIEDELTIQYGFTVRVLDRTWILDKVFQNRRENLAIEALKIDLPQTQVVNKGSLDTAREAELDELEIQIQDSVRYKGVEYQLFEDCLEAAILSRGLELPRVETDGRFLRAERVAQQYGTIQQLLRCAYAKAWTAFNWYDDFHTFNLLYDDVERFTIGSTQATDLQLLVNLWFLLRASVSLSFIETSASKLDERTARLRSELKRLQFERHRPSNALHARSNELLIDLCEARYSSNSIESQRIFKQLQEVFLSSEGLVNFPIGSLIKILMELGENLTDDPGFDELFETLLSVSQQRESKATSGGMLLKRGSQKFRNGNFYEAIRLLGRAQQDLALHECRGELIAALALCASAYEAAGLLWAARANMIAAASLALTEFWKEGKITVQALACLQRLIWVEIQLGRVPITLSWIATASSVAATLTLDDESREEFLKERESQDLVLGILLLKARFDDLKHLGFLPEILKRLGLASSYVAALYALGHEDTLKAEEWIPQEESESSIYELFSNWLTLPASQDLPKTSEFLANSEIEISSQVLGCNIIAKVPNNNNSLFIAESVFAALEAFLATSLDANIFPHQSDFQLQLILSQSISSPIDFQIKDANGKPWMEIQYFEEFDISNPERKQLFRDKLIELIIQLITQITFIPNPKEFFENLVKNELVLARALNFTDIATGIENILGDRPKLRISEWQPEDNTDFIPVRRVKCWNSEIAKPGKGEPPLELKNIESLKHRDRKILSLLNVNLWNQAGWSATGFGFIPELYLPVLTLLFRNESASKNIFIQWREEIGTEDVEEKLRISIITGIDSDNPAAYRMVIGINPDWSETTGNVKSSQFISMSRIHTMNPVDSRNLDQFLSAFEKTRAYVLAPGYVSQNNSKVDFFVELGVLKRQIFVRPAWQIEEHDIDMCGLQFDDKVIVPKDVKEPPVARALARLREMERRRSSEK